jgi:uncharacterized protein YaaN involved in tellurite resistance
MYKAQLVEHAIVDMMLHLHFIPRNKAKKKDEWEHEYTLFYKKNFERSLGKLINFLKTYVEIDDTLEELLSKCLRTRNYLAHDYYKERSIEITYYEGRDAMMKELMGYQELFDNTVEYIEREVAPSIRKLGISQEIVDKAFDQLVQESKDKLNKKSPYS